MEIAFDLYLYQHVSVIALPRYIYICVCVCFSGRLDGMEGYVYCWSQRKNPGFVWRVLELAGDSFMGWLRWQSDSLVMIPDDIFAHMTQLSTSNLRHWLDVHWNPIIQLCLRYSVWVSLRNFSIITLDFTFSGSLNVWKRKKYAQTPCY